MTVDFPQLKLQANIIFPGTVSGGPGISVGIANGNYSINLAYPEFLPPVNVVTDPTNTLVLAWNQVTLQYSLITASSAFGAPTNNPTFTGTIALSGNTTVTGTLGVSGAITAASLTATGAVNANGVFSTDGMLAQTGVGYRTGSGAGGAVTQATSRTTGVTLNNPTGAITLFAAAPVVGTWFSFPVANSSVAATDTVSVAVKSASNTYNAIVSAVAAGSFQISMASMVGTTSDSPVVNFNVIKGSAT